MRRQGKPTREQEASDNIGANGKVDCSSEMALSPSFIGNILAVDYITIMTDVVKEILQTIDQRKTSINGFIFKA